MTSAIYRALPDRLSRAAAESIIEEMTEVLGRNECFDRYRPKVTCQC